MSSSSSFPSSSARWGALGLLWLGALLGYLVSPLVWLVAGPIRWLGWMAATAATESGYNPDAQGAEENGTTSYGMLQFNSTNAYLFRGVSWSSPFWQGIAAARYVQSAILTDWRWLLLRLPFVGFEILRLLWRGGPGSAGRWAEAASYTEERARSAARAWSLVLFIPSVLFSGWLFGLLWHGRRGGR